MWCVCVVGYNMNCGSYQGWNHMSNQQNSGEISDFFEKRFLEKMSPNMT
jgi:hypothetical protein